ncbi:MAG TPA: hypothetical protein VIG85_05610 [Comamonas sp.]
MSLQRMLQKGRDAFDGANRLGPPHVGHFTVVEFAVLLLMLTV